MAKTLTDLSQLTKAILKESPPSRPVDKSALEPSQSREDADAAAVLAYFSRPSQNAPRRNRAAPFVFPGISGFPQEVQQEETPAAQPVVEENVAFPILIGIP